MTDMLTVDSVSKRYGKVQALDAVSLEIRPGVFGLLGPNGAGKTTLMRIIASVLRQDSGTVRMGNVSWDRPRDVRRMLGYLPQRFDFFRYLTVRESLEYIAAMKELPARETHRQVKRALALTGLAEYVDRKNRTLSGGMLRRLGVAQAVLGSPRLLVMDEPTAGLDPAERARFRQTIAEIAAAGTTVLLSTHMVEEVAQLCGQAAVLWLGKVLASGSPKEIASLAAGRVRQETMSRKAFAQLAASGQVLVSSANVGDGVRARWLTASPADGAEPPTLEDAYLLLTGGAGDGHA